ncbi:DUF4079 family protein [Salidesulfovibrio onnuriiensis]|uniref:DUF4079 family protein n=1 Tax=Salidesulfovibrio onnuriiensis TaxID=2583823 RepID=UPI0011CA9D9D|nr:DUF4079 family protein [Salidesulfovibrio onnuriiensis]
MLWFHPVLQALTTLLALYVAFTGLNRFLTQHLQISRPFQWRIHVQLGKLAILLWFAGFVGGLMVARMTWSVNFITGRHYQTALIMLPLLIFGYLSGIIMDAHKKPRGLLSLLHAANNITLLGLALYQFWTGWAVLREYLL